MSQITVDDVQQARTRIASLVDPSPVVRSLELSRRLGVEVWLKLETMHPPGSFKVRGAANKMLAMTDEQLSRGVVACSGGNHGAAVAYIAHRLGVPATVCVPETVDPKKLQTIRDFGAEVIAQGATFDEASHVSRQVEAERNLSYVHPFDDPYVIAGQGTIGLELLDQLAELSTVVAAVSGGGLAAGIGLSLRSRRPAASMIGASAENAATMVASLKAGHPVDLPAKDTLAEVLAGGIELENQWSFRAVQEFVDRHVLVTEDEIAEAMRFAFSAHHLVVEGAGAVGIAAGLAGKIKPQGGPIAIVVSGGNVDPAVLFSLGIISGSAF